MCSERKSANASSGWAAGVPVMDHVLTATTNDDDQSRETASKTSMPVASEEDDTTSFASVRRSTAISRSKVATCTSRNQVPVEPPLKALSLDDALELEFTGPDYGEKVRAMLAKRFVSQTHSNLQLGSQSVVALWDTGCSLGGITTEAKLDALKAGGGDAIERVVLYDTFQPVNGISDPPVMIIGHALLRFNYGPRFFKVICSIMRGGDVGQATLLIGNRHMWRSHWGALIDFDFKKLVMLRADDGGGELTIAIDWRINHTDVRSTVD